LVEKSSPERRSTHGQLGWQSYQALPSVASYLQFWDFVAPPLIGMQISGLVARLIWTEI
jgi:hypothetical protein